MSELVHKDLIDKDISRITRAGVPVGDHAKIRRFYADKAGSYRRDLFYIIAYRVRHLAFGEVRCDLGYGGK